MKKTISFESTIGIIEGYYHDNIGVSYAYEQFCSIIQLISKELFEEKGMYISTVINESKTIYNTDWGCPSGGELTFTITGIANPEFVKNIEQWKENVTILIYKIKKYYKQSTVTLQFNECEICYMR